jgi:hypothetical protein
MTSVRPQVDFGGSFFSGEIRVFRGGKYVIKRLELSAARMWEPNTSQWRRTIFWFLLLTEQWPSAIYGSIFRETLHRKNALLNKAPLPLTSDTVDLIFNLTVNVLLSREHYYRFRPRLRGSNGRTITVGYCSDNVMQICVRLNCVA